MESSSERLKFKVVEKHIEGMIQKGQLKNGDQVPSINDILQQQGLARKTIQKAYLDLVKRGILVSVPRKGYFVASTNVELQHNVFLLFDNFTSYKQTLFHAIRDAFCEKANLNLHFHYFNPSVFERTINDNIGKYTSYVVLPCSEKADNAVLGKIPCDSLFLLIRRPEGDCNFSGVFQDFENDIEKSLRSTGNLMWKYSRLNLLFHDTFTVPPPELLKGFKHFCDDLKMEYKVCCGPFSKPLKKGEAYIVIDENDLKNILLEARRMNLTPGSDIGIISYNDTPLKEVVSISGISVISTDFAQMGKTIVEMILTKDYKAIKNPCRFIDRGSF